MPKYEDIVILKPYIAPEHRALLNRAESQLAEYTTWLVDKLKPKASGTAIQVLHSERDMIKARYYFLNDPIRLAMIKNIVKIKGIVEKPRLLIKHKEKQNGTCKV